MRLSISASDLNISLQERNENSLKMLLIFAAKPHYDHACTPGSPDKEVSQWIDRYNMIMIRVHVRLFRAGKSGGAPPQPIFLK